MRLNVTLTDEEDGLVVVVDQQFEEWPAALDTFLAALMAAKFVLDPSEAIDDVVTQLRQHQAALKPDTSFGGSDFGIPCCE